MNAEKPETLVATGAEVPERLKCDGSADRGLRQEEKLEAVRKLAEEANGNCLDVFLCNFAHGLSQLLLVEPAIRRPIALPGAGSADQRSGFSAFMS